MSTAILASLALTFGPADGATTPKSRAIGRLPIAKVLHVADGDTIVVGARGRITKVRLLGVEAPETAHEEACRLLRVQFLKGLLDGQSVRLAYPPGATRDRQGRTPARVYRASDRLWINREMVARGYGRAAPDAPTAAEAAFPQAEAAARGGRLGVWDPEALRAAIGEVERKAQQAQREREQAVARRQAQRMRAMMRRMGESVLAYQEARAMEDLLGRMLVEYAAQFRDPIPPQPRTRPDDRDSRDTDRREPHASTIHGMVGASPHAGHRN
jgi:endonuclease YncB( thermonuclease family)